MAPLWSVPGSTPVPVPAACVLTKILTKTVRLPTEINDAHRRREDFSFRGGLLLSPAVGVGVCSVR